MPAKSGTRLYFYNVRDYDPALQALGGITGGTYVASLLSQSASVCTILASEIVVATAQKSGRYAG